MNIKTQSGLAIITSILVACGGGGGSPVSAPAPAPAAAPAPAPAPVAIDTSLQSAVPLATYAAASQELAGLTVLNDARSKCGFGLLKQSTQLDTAAAAHASYVVNTHDLGHFETQAGHEKYFTGVAPLDREKAAGYQAVDGTESLSVNPGTSQFGDFFTRQLLSSPFHLVGMMRPWRDVGVGVASSAYSPTLTFNALVFDYGYTTAIQETSEVKTFPCEGSSNVLSFPAGGENPDPFPGRNYYASPLGAPILVKGPDSGTLVVTSASVKPVGGADMKLNILTAATYPSYMRASEVVIIPDDKMADNTVYQVSIAGTSKGVPFAKAFTFTSGVYTTGIF